MFDSEAIHEVSKKTGASEADIKASLVISIEYNKILQKLKSARRAKRNSEINARLLAEEKQAHPEKCFCEEDGVKIFRDVEKDEVIRHIRVISYHGFYPHETCLEPIYRCSTCGKEYRILIAWA